MAHASVVLVLKLVLGICQPKAVRQSSISPEALPFPNGLIAI
jgi:hypothetical protein